MAENINNAEALNYRNLRRVLGYLGLLLTLILLAYSVLDALFWDGPGLRPSISDYYYSHVGDIFVGLLCIIGFFFVLYDGHSHTAIELASPRFIDKITDRQVALVGGFGAFGTALFPLRGPACGDACTEFTGFHVTTNIIHFVSAGAFLLSTAAFCIILFTRGNGTQDNKVEHKGGTIVKIAWTPRNRFFVTCGLIIVICVAALGAYKVADLANLDDIVDMLDRASFVFWAEVIAVLAFSQAWLEKGKSNMSALPRIARSTRNDPERG